MLHVPVLFLLAACGKGTPDESGVDDTDPGDDTDGTTVVDADGDGSAVPEDCDDADPAVHPGADEHCDGVDEDCGGDGDAGAVDAGTWYADADGDGFGDASAATGGCEPPAGFVADATDCDDGADAAHPGADELACTAVDEDCDGAFDEGDDSAMGVLLNGRIYANLQNGFNAAEDGDTLWVCPGVYDADRLPITVFLTPTLVVASSARDASRTVLDGEGIDRIISFSGPTTFRDLTFRNGRAEDGDGGAIWANGDLTVERCAFEGNSAFEGGGAIAWSYGHHVAITDSVFTDNYAFDSGGALLVEGTLGWEDWDLTVTGTRFERNRSTAHGGAIGMGYGVGWSVVLDGDAFTDNEAGAGGSAVSRSGGNSGDTAIVDVRSSTFDGNASDGSGVLELAAETLDFGLTDTVFADNTAVRGPLVSAYGAGTYTLTRAGFVRNIADDDGVIVAVWDSGITLVSVDSDWGTGADSNGGIDLSSRCGNYDLGADESFTCSADGVWTE
jgi:hypothetical protein